MGVYIPDMQMPKCCDECSIRHMTLSWCNVAKRSTSHSEGYKPLDQSKRPSWCPLVGLPKKHGRLFDADEVKKCVNEVEDCEDKAMAIAMLEWAIEKRWCIEAEGGD